MNAKIIGVGEFLPGEPISNATMEARCSLRADWVDMVIGTRTRHFAVDLNAGEVVFDLAALAVRAAERALASAQLEKDDVDLIVQPDCDGGEHVLIRAGRNPFDGLPLAGFQPAVVNVPGAGAGGLVMPDDMHGAP